MMLLGHVENVFEIPQRGCVIVPRFPEGTDFKIRVSVQIQLRTSDGVVTNTHIASVELLKVAGGPCRLAIMLPPNLTKHDVPIGTEIWLQNQC